MNAPFLSRPTDSDKIRREIDALEAEIEAARCKRDGISRAIADRQLKLERLKSQHAMIAVPGSPLAALG